MPACGIKQARRWLRTWAQGRPCGPAADASGGPAADVSLNRLGGTISSCSIGVILGAAHVTIGVAVRGEGVIRAERRRTKQLVRT